MHLIIYVNEKNCEVSSYIRGELQSHKHWDIMALTSYIDSLPQSTYISLVIDTAEEQIHTEYVPSLLPWEKLTLQKRLTEKNKQKAAYAQHFFWSGIKKSNADNRNQESLITFILTPQDRLANLIKVIQQNHLIWVGCYSATFLLKQYLFKEVKLSAQLTNAQLKLPLLVFAKMSQTQYRQGFLVKGKLQLTRLIAYETEVVNEQQRVDFLLNEARLASRFIYNQGLLERDLPISYIVIDALSKDAVETLKQQFVSENLVTNSTAQAQQFIQVHSLSSYGDGEGEASHPGLAPRLIGKLRHAMRPSFYSLPYIQVSNGFRVGRSLLVSLVLVASLVFAILGIHASIQHYFLNQKADLLATTEAVLSDKKHTLLEQAQGRESVNDMDAIVRFTDALKQINAAEAYGLELQGLSHVIQQNPNIKVNSINWQPTATFDSALVNLNLQGLIHPFEGQFIPMKRLLDQFVAALLDLEQVNSVVIVQQPFTEQQMSNFHLSQLPENASLSFVLEMQVLKSLPKLPSLRVD
ncbi:hypothetical protein P8S54_10780 [Thiomicrospira sp. R3]|uniref:hypothetical protein n=1 Tax=Thiomicrospira sp. R3 TaxID=3035472 RepID=UPI00259B98C7|nr:hypothetical protein [Thiomicrospira sp. R3]WFE68678.1 hypothetical protein P8S54_10780 [Thiomicrospira sp. R3]